MEKQTLEKMAYGKSKRLEGNLCVVYVTRLKPLYDGEKDRYWINALAYNGSGKKGRGFEAASSEEAAQFINDFIN